jgi:hypothetical protein
MPKWNLEELNERERACLGHLEQAKKLETAAALSWRSEQSTGVPRNEASRMVQSAWSVGLQLSRLIAVIRRRTLCVFYPFVPGSH